MNAPTRRSPSLTPQYKTVYKCCACGSPSYQREIVRDPVSGALVTTAAYRCAGCRTVFTDLQAWCNSRHVVREPETLVRP